ncbi:hypothetical protein BB559_004321 [Furculomyces boomerangus]|uniref:Tethering factor for nuclear proteasome STS1 n=2 Tax=Harpellales TaxID=61421 RepID=A0A2T9YFE2_9FUNG|nr:hypothetical protein BB559_006084 [Furculomyces boomerangus]PVU91061.1 hypothetical protein BB559_004321 [Furculomyces boomerangus]PVZ99538.1 hypothetical protein BB558_004460 [Smittium angustum]
MQSVQKDKNLETQKSSIFLSQVSGINRSLGPQWGAGLNPISGFTNPFQTPEKQKTFLTSSQSVKSSAKRKQSSDDESMASSSPDISKPKRFIENRISGSSKSKRIPDASFSKMHNIDSGLTPTKHHGSEAHLTKSSQSSGARPIHGLMSKLNGKKRAKSDQRVQEITLDKLLEPLEKRDLLNLLTTLVENNRHLERELREALPTPTIASACLQLGRLEQKMQSSIPYSRTGAVYDEYTYNRLRPALHELHETIVMYVDHFCHGGLLENINNMDASSGSRPTISHPAEWFELLNFATEIACRMPKWQEPDFNNIQISALRYISNAWHRAILATSQWVEGGHALGQDMVTGWEKSLVGFSQSCGYPDLFLSPVLAFSQQFGWVTGSATPLFGRQVLNNTSLFGGISVEGLSVSENTSNSSSRSNQYEFAWPAN